MISYRPFYLETCLLIQLFPAWAVVILGGVLIAPGLRRSRRKVSLGRIAAYGFFARWRSALKPRRPQLQPSLPPGQGFNDPRLSTTQRMPVQDFQWGSIYFTAIVTVLLVCPATVIVTGTVLPTATVAGTIAFTWYNPA